MKTGKKGLALKQTKTSGVTNDHALDNDDSSLEQELVNIQAVKKIAPQFTLLSDVMCHVKGDLFQEESLPHFF